MELFDFDRHYKRIKLATTPEEIAQIRNEYDIHFESLPKDEQEIFVLRLSQYAHEEVIRSKALIEFVKEVIDAEHQAV
ncbi:hypothetical protein GO730_18265 [Spirosoma sp. HMF3257]|uniref:Uncharacterized protein n=1 Tax=Spirosoma telluris TaxID=2183553 RepID=A0A327NJS8_9BACT|nr:hypothetical protein [Spirosoma telluris]RAI75611.1 hypothetical protein HMF3257_18190 [Spirosoma telluris]